MFGPLFGVLVVGQLSTIPRHPKPTPPPPITTAIDMTIKTAAGETHASVSPKVPPAVTRAIVQLKSGEKPQIKWQVRNLDLKATVTNIVVHFLIHKEEATGATIPAAPEKGSYQDSVFGMDLAPRDYTSGEFNTAISEPGVYLVDVELLDEHGTRRQYCALDLKVE